jgi:hypothetical protein
MEEFQFLEISLKIGSMLRLLPLGDLFAEGARMLAIEGLCESRWQGSGAGIVGEHGGPRDRLQHHPMRAGRAQQGNDQQQMSKAGEHEMVIGQGRRIVKQLNRIMDFPGYNTNLINRL